MRGWIDLGESGGPGYLAAKFDDLFQELFNIGSHPTFRGMTWQWFVKQELLSIGNPGVTLILWRCSQGACFVNGPCHDNSHIFVCPLVTRQRSGGRLVSLQGLWESPRLA